MSEKRVANNPLLANLYRYRPWHQMQHTGNQLYKLFNTILPPEESLWRENFPCPSQTACVFGEVCSFSREAQRDYSFNADAHKQTECESSFDATKSLLRSRSPTGCQREEELSAEDYNAIWQQCAPCEPGPYRVFLDPPPAPKIETINPLYKLQPQEYAHQHHIFIYTKMCRHFYKTRVFHQQDCRIRSAAHSFAQFIAPFETAALLAYFTHWCREALKHSPAESHVPNLPLVAFSARDLPTTCPSCFRRDTLEITATLQDPNNFAFPFCITTCNQCNLQCAQSIYK